MPELRSVLGYPLALLVMLASTLVLHRFFRRIEWL
jgi:Mg2+ and Co2+ transporter CorA